MSYYRLDKPEKYINPNGSFWDSKLHNKIQKVEADPNLWKPNKKLFQLTPQKEYAGSRYSSGTDSSGGFWQSKLFNKIKKDK